MEKNSALSSSTQQRWPLICGVPCLTDSADVVGKEGKPQRQAGWCCIMEDSGRIGARAVSVERRTR